MVSFAGPLGTYGTYYPKSDKFVSSLGSLYREVLNMDDKLSLLAKRVDQLEQAKQPENRSACCQIIIYDQLTGLEWLTSVKHLMTKEQVEWVELVDGKNGGWRIPDIEEVLQIWDTRESAGELVSELFTDGGQFVWMNRNGAIVRRTCFTSQAWNVLFASLDITGGRIFLVRSCHK